MSDYLPLLYSTVASIIYSLPAHSTFWPKWVVHVNKTTPLYIDQNVVSDLKLHISVRVTDLHAFYWVGQRTGSVDEVSVFHVFCYSLQKAQRLIKDDGHRDLWQFLRGKNKHTLSLSNAILSAVLSLLMRFMFQFNTDPATLSQGRDGVGGKNER